MKNKCVENPQALDYPVRIEYDNEDSVFIAEFPDLPGCSATGSTVAEAYDRACKAKLEWLRVTSEQGLPIPAPTRIADYSGRLLVRLPASLHAILADRARLNGSSLNQYIVHLLSAGALRDEADSKFELIMRQLRRTERAVASALQEQSVGQFSRADRSEIYGWQAPEHQSSSVQRPSASSALDAARIQ